MASQIKVDTITNAAGTGATNFSSGATITGVTNGSNAASGVVGELVISQANVSVTTSNTAVTSISLTAGDWDIVAWAGSVNGTGAAGTNNALQFYISTTSASSAGTTNSISAFTVTTTGSYGGGASGRYPVNITSTTVYYLNGNWLSSSGTVQGYITARRMR